MGEKRSKYDTDPLDPDFVRRTEEMMEATQVSARETQPEPRAERAQSDPSLEEPTRRFDEGFSNSYPSVFVPPVYQPPVHQPGYTSFGTDGQQAPRAAEPNPAAAYEAGSRPSSRPVQKLGLAENLACILPYAPAYIGLVVSIVELFIVPRTETRTRFHAAQGLALQLVLTAGAFAFEIVETFTGSGLGGALFWLASTIFLIVSMVRVWHGRPHHIAALDDPTRWLNEKIEPRGK